MKWFWIFLAEYRFISEQLHCCVCTEDVVDKQLCKYKLSEADVTRLRDAIEDLYYFEFVIGLHQFTQFTANVHIFLDFGFNCML